MLKEIKVVMAVLRELGKWVEDFGKVLEWSFLKSDEIVLHFNWVEKHMGVRWWWWGVVANCVQLSPPVMLWTAARQAPQFRRSKNFLQARTLEWVAISFSRGSYQLRDRIHVSCIGGGFFTAEPPRKHQWV